jgi:pimeloyl-ACP methyl ester carboxylesterase
VKVPPFEVAGSGEPLLLLSAYTVPAAALNLVRAPLAEHYTVVTFDYPGSGVARAPMLPLTIAGIAASAVNLLDHLGIESAHVYGISMGGLVAQELAIRFPERVRALVLGSTSPGGFHASRTDPLTFIAGMSSIRTRVAGGYGGRLIGAFHQGYAAMLHDTSGSLDRIQAKTLIVHGERDMIVPLGNGLLLHKRIPGSSLVVLPGDGHFHAFDDPVTNSELVLSWLDKAAPFPVGHRSCLRHTLEPYSRAAALPLGATKVYLTAGRLVLAGALHLSPWWRPRQPR